MSTRRKEWIFMSGMPVHDVIRYGQPFCLLEVRVIIICWRVTCDQTSLTFFVAAGRDAWSQVTVHYEWSSGFFFFSLTLSCLTLKKTSGKNSSANSSISRGHLFFAVYLRSCSTDWANKGLPVAYIAEVSYFFFRIWSITKRCYALNTGYFQSYSQREIL